MDQYFQQMVKIIRGKKVSSRTRFMLQDVVDLRENNWVPRRDDSGPKTIDQIHKEAKLQEQQIELNLQKAARAKRLGGIENVYFVLFTFFSQLISC